MKFNYFRIALTLLASFGAFFAYICRLNLSLIINDMVVKDTPPALDDLAQEANPQAIRSTDDNPFIYNEEHALAGFYSKLQSRSHIRSVQNKKYRSAKIKHNPLSTLAIITMNVSNYEEKVETAIENVNKANDTQVNNGDEVVVEPSQYLLNWNEMDRNEVLSAFFVGYVVSQIPSARAGEIFGAKSLFLITGFGAGFCSLLFPYAARCSTSIWPAYVLRLIMGASQGALFPGVYVLLCEWLPANERSKWLAWPSAFSRFGLIVMSLLLPKLVNSYGWDSCFYICGAATLVQCSLFIIFGSNSPDQSYWISKQELIYIESHMEPRVGTLAQQQDISASGFTINESAKPAARPSVSWKKLITNKAILILSLVMFTSEWSNMLLLVKLPGFLAPVLNMDTEEIGSWNSILVGIYCIQYPLSGWCASKLENSENEWLSSLRVRKIFELAAHSMQGIGCCIIAFSAHKAVVISALFLMMLGRATVGGGQCLMPPELSRDYPGTVFAFANTLANLAGIIGPKAVGWLVVDTTNHDSWFPVWIGSGLLFFISGAIFCVMADNRPQNYCRKGKASKKPSKSLSLAQLTVDLPPQEPEIFKMDAFSRVASEPNPKIDPPRLSTFEAKPTKVNKLV